MLNKITYGPLFIILAAVLWAFDGVIRRSLFSLPPIQIVFLEHLVGSIFLLPIILKLKLTDFKKVWKDIVIVVIFSGFLGTLLFTAALQKVFFISFSVVFLLQKLQPLFAIASAKMLLNEKFSKKYWLWAAVSLIAAYYITFPTGGVSMSEHGDNIMAALFALGAAFFWGVSTTFSKRILKKIDSKKATSFRFLGTTILAGLVFFIFQASSFVIPDLSQWAHLVFIALSTGMVALYFYYKGLQRTSVRVSTLLELVFPMLAIIIDAVLYKTYLVPVQYIAVGVLFYSLSKVVRLDKSDDNSLKFEM